MKNFGLNPNITAKRSDFVETKKSHLKAEKFAKRAKADFAAYQKMAEPKKATQTCKTYLCNWQGLAILGSTCPCCGQKLYKV